jgi:hypothetical protein
MSKKPKAKKKKRKLTAAEKAARKRRRAEFRTVFINGKMKRVRRPPTIDGMDADEFIRQNADPTWLHENEMWEFIEADPPARPLPDEDSPSGDEDLPF